LSANDIIPQGSNTATASPPGISVDEMMSYRDGFKNLLRLVIVESCLIVVLLAGVFYYLSSVKPQDRYFAENIGGTKREMVGLVRPNMSQQAVLSWAAAAVSQIMTFGFNNVDESMAKAKKNFTSEGWESFSTAMKKTSLLHLIVENQQLLTSVAVGTPTMVREGMMGGDYVWIVNMKIVMTTRAADQKQTGHANVRLILTRLPTAANPMGLGIKIFFLY
jgi:hypothetical protein